MKYDRRTPCPTCPWRELAASHPEEQEEIRDGLRKRDNTQSCHETILPGEAPHCGEQHCAGALIAQERLNLRSNPAQRAYEAGIYDPYRLNFKVRLHPAAGLPQAPHRLETLAVDMAGEESDKTRLHIQGPGMMKSLPMDRRASQILHGMLPMFDGRRVVMAYGRMKRAMDDFRYVRETVMAIDGMEVDVTNRVYRKGKGEAQFIVADSEQRVSGIEASFVVHDEFDDIPRHIMERMIHRTQLYESRKRDER